MKWCWEFTKEHFLLHCWLHNDTEFPCLSTGAPAFFQSVRRVKNGKKASVQPYVVHYHK